MDDTTMPLLAEVCKLPETTVTIWRHPVTGWAISTGFSHARSEGNPSGSYLVAVYWDDAGRP